jgi:hypothetical protein
MLWPKRQDDDDEIVHFFDERVHRAMICRTYIEDLVLPPYTFELAIH